MDGARRVKDIEKYTSLLPFFGTDYGLCTLIKPQITFDKDLEEIPFNELMRNYTKSIKPGIQLGKENGLSILLDAEVCTYLEYYYIYIHSSLFRNVSIFAIFLEYENVIFCYFSFLSYFIFLPY